MERRAKIICTLGPSVGSSQRISELIDAGMDVARLNFSHGKHDEHAQRLSWVREASSHLGKHVAVLQDLSGPKVRTGVIGDKPTVGIGDVVTLVEGTEAKFPEVPIVLDGFGARLEKGDRVLLDDGRVTLRVEERLEGGRRVRCHSETEGELRDRVGVHLPARSVGLASFTDKDRRDLAFGLDAGVDYVAVSFVRQAEDIRQVRGYCSERGMRVPLVAKIETPPAIEDLDAILEEADAVMVARGDLGVEFPPEQVPVLQRMIIDAARLRRRPVIVATEMLHSMVHSKRPTRAEASDVAHAVFEGADAVMLSAETATGDHPSLAVAMMERIVLEAEKSMVLNGPRHARADMAESIAFNAADIAEEVGATAIVAFTSSGRTARLMAGARSRVPLVAFCPSSEGCRQLALLWGTRTLVAEQVHHSDAMLALANDALLAAGIVKKGDRFVVAFGAPVGSGAETNSISIRVAG